jgi:hypothetical protein
VPQKATESITKRSQILVITGCAIEDSLDKSLLKEFLQNFCGIKPREQLPFCGETQFFNKRKDHD